MGDRLLTTISLFDIVKYTSDKRPHLLEDHLVVVFRVVSCHRFYCIRRDMKRHHQWPITVSKAWLLYNTIQPVLPTTYIQWYLYIMTI